LNGFHCWSLNVSSTHIAISIESGVNCPWRRMTPRSQAPLPLAGGAPAFLERAAIFHQRVGAGCTGDPRR
jgi:hypothetical protein